jgi:hypothetical protein
MQGLNTQATQHTHKTPIENKSTLPHVFIPSLTTSRPGTGSLSHFQLVTPTANTSVQDNTRSPLSLDVGHSRPEPV